MKEFDYIKERICHCHAADLAKYLNVKRYKYKKPDLVSMVLDQIKTIDDAKKLLCERFDSIDYEQAKNDVRPFVKDAAALEIWNADFFKQITRELNFDTVSVL